MAPGFALTAIPKEPDTPIFPKATQNTDNPVHEQPTLAPGIHVLHPSLIPTDFDALRFEAAAYTQLFDFPPPVASDLPPPTPFNSVSDADPFIPPLDKVEHSEHTPPRAELNATSPSSKLTASTWLDRPTPDIKTPRYSTHLISSPYNSPGHYLNLTTLTTPHLLLAKALTALKPARPDYATAPYSEALNFPDVLEVLRRLCRQAGVEWTQHSWYVVVFRSVLKESVVRVAGKRADGKLSVNEEFEELYELDFESHGEACLSGGLLKYWFGSCDSQRQNLATCEYLHPLFVLIFSVNVSVCWRMREGADSD